jgi:sterol desaturase/sphingolipid hydroxylase (fatty acid hydroxylase superfamily)
LPKSLSIELYSRDHLLHHTKPNTNFSKRFSIWDKLFFTYKENDRSIQ